MRRAAHSDVLWHHPEGGGHHARLVLPGGDQAELLVQATVTQRGYTCSVQAGGLWHAAGGGHGLAEAKRECERQARAILRRLHLVAALRPGVPAEADRNAHPLWVAAPGPAGGLLLHGRFGHAPAGSVYFYTEERQWWRWRDGLDAWAYAPVVGQGGSVAKDW